MGLGILKDGKWISEREQEDDSGRFVRPSTTFRNSITADGSSGFKAEPGRYHLLYFLGLSLGLSDCNYATIKRTARCDRFIGSRSRN